MRRRWILVGVMAAGLAAPFALSWLRVAVDDRGPSRAIGHPGDGRLENGHVLRPWGPGWITYSWIGAALGRQYAHAAVLSTLGEAFAARAAAVPGQRFIVGEIAAHGGGRFHGHRTHQNGLSVDLFMPVRDENGERAELPTWPWLGFGYWWEFDSLGAARGLRIDFAELGEVLREIDRHAAAHGLHVVRVIVAPEYAPLISAGALNAKLTRRPVWVRHDEHVHIDFAVGSEAAELD